MKTITQFLIYFCVIFTFNVNAQFNHPTTSIQSEYVGACLVSTCAATYFDNGGAGGNYSNDINNIYRVFCPNTAGQCLRVTFYSFNVENAGFFGTVFDWLNVKNGPTQNSPNFTTAPANGAGEIFGTPAVPFSYTATGPSGCLTFRFNSDGSVTRPGWSATLQCVPCAGGPNGTDNNDCINLTPICSSANINGSATGPGIVAEGCTGSSCPAGGENHTNWYTFTAQTTGTLNITIAPNVGSGDYDFAIYGPNVTCGALGNPIRCTDSGTTGTTGLTSTAGDFTEDVTGDKFLQTMNVIAGQSYIMVIDEWSPNSAGGYTLSFTGTVSLDCTILPVELSSFETSYNAELNVVDINWITESERDCDYFEVERSFNGEDFETIHRVKGMGNTTLETQYYVEDPNQMIGVNYYRLKQFDFNGEFNYSEVRSVNILSDEYDLISVFPNPTTDMTEIVFNSYDKEGALLKIISPEGRVIVNTPIGTNPGGNRVNVDLSEKAKGIYIVSVTTKEKVYTTRLLKQ